MSLEPFNQFSHTQKKIQEALDKDKTAALIRNQTSAKEKTRLQSLSLPHPSAWLAPPPIPALGLQLSAKKFPVSLSTGSESRFMIKKENVLITGQVH